MSTIRCILLAAIALAVYSSPAFAVRETHSASYPSISADGETVYFSCWGDIWSAPRDAGSPARRLTDNVAYEGRPMVSPDGKQLAFVSDRYGNYDIFVMPVDGGPARQLTWDSTSDYLYDWKPDGSAILAYTDRQDKWGQCAYEIQLDGSEPVRLTGPDHDDHVFVSYLGDKNEIVYTRGPGDWAQKRIRGSRNYDLWHVDLRTGHHKPLTEWTGKDAWPQPSPDGKYVYFVSDRDGTENIWQLEMATGKFKQLSFFKTDGPRWPRISDDGDEIIADVFGELWVIPTDGGKAERVPVLINDDPKHEMRLDITSSEIGEYAVSPNGNYFAVTIYGDIYILKNPDKYEEGDEPNQDLGLARPLVTGPGREKQITWHPGSTKIAYVSDRNDQFDVYTFDLVTMEETRITSTSETETYPAFAPKGERLAFYSGKHKLMVHELETGNEFVLHEALQFWGVYPDEFAWAPDGYWIAMQKTLLDYQTEIYLINIEDREPVNISQTELYSGSSVWTEDGKYLVYQNRTDEGSEIMLLELDPEAYEFDTDLLFEEDLPKPDEDEEEAKAGDEDADDDEAGEQEKGPYEDLEPLKIDFNRIEDRARVMTDLEGYAYYPVVDPDSSYIVFVTDHSGENEFYSVNIEDGELNRIDSVNGRDYLQFAPDGKKLYYIDGSRIGYWEMGGGKAKGGGRVSCSGQMTFDQYAIWEQMMKEGWRIMRDSFYDPEMGGLDWNDVYKRYLPRVMECGTPYEYGGIYREMLGELGRSHLGFYGYGDTQEAPSNNTCAFGVLYDESYDGWGWKVDRILPDTPAEHAGSRLYPGDIILEVNGTKVDRRTNKARLLNNKQSEPVKLLVKSSEAALAALRSDEAGEDLTEREVIIRPVSKRSLDMNWYEQWVEDNRETTYKKSNNRIAYQHIRKMYDAETKVFKRELFTESFDKDALIIDVRFNSGGSSAVDILNILDERPAYLRRPRGGDMRFGRQLVWQGPVVVLINAHSFSNAEILAHILKDAGIAVLIGEDTPGGVISTNQVTLLDGSGLAVAAGANYRLNGEDMETGGAEADVYIHIDPNLLAEGEDNQLNAAIEYLLKELDE